MAKLKVFRTAAGFHDAYVAAPSRKAALAAWGAEADLFARGVAEEVTDAALTKAPLAQPGEVIRVSRGSAAEQLAEAGRAKPTSRATKSAVTSKPTQTTPKPSRDKLAKAEAALAQAEERRRAEEAALAAEQEALDRRKRDVAAAHKRARMKLEAAVDEEQDAYDAALAKWRE